MLVDFEVKAWKRNQHIFINDFILVETQRISNTDG